MRRSASALVMLAWASLTLTTAAAEPPPVEIAVEPYEPLVRPEREARLINVTVEVGCNQDDLVPGGLTAVEFQAGSVPPWAAVSLSTARAARPTDPQKCLDASHRETFGVTLTVTLAKDAPAFREAPAQLLVTVEKPQPPQGKASYGPYAANVSFAATYVPRVVYEPASYARTLAPSSNATIPIRVANLGNGATRITTDVTQGRGPHLEAVVPPAEVILGAPGDAAPGEANRTLELAVTAGPSRVHAFHTLHLTFQAASTDPRGDATDTKEIFLSFEVKVGGASPGPSAPTVALAAAAAALGLAFTRGRPRRPRACGA